MYVYAKQLQKYGLFVASPAKAGVRVFYFQHLFERVGVVLVRNLAEAGVVEHRLRRPCNILGCGLGEQGGRYAFICQVAACLIHVVVPDCRCHVNEFCHEPLVGANGFGSEIE